MTESVKIDSVHPKANGDLQGTDCDSGHSVVVKYDEIAAHLLQGQQGKNPPWFKGKKMRKEFDDEADDLRWVLAEEAA